MAILPGMRNSRHYMTFAALPLLAAVACTPLPDVPPLPDNGAPPPMLAPLDSLMAGIPSPRATDAASNALAARAARLQARAALMRGPVLDPETRRKLAAAIARGAA
jgi:hypothetical protein